MIDFKNPAALRELINETARGPWERLDTPDYAEIWNGTLESPLALVDDPDNADFIAISREALPYWMERAEAAEAERATCMITCHIVSDYAKAMELETKAMKRLAKELMNGYGICPPECNPSDKSCLLEIGGLHGGQVCVNCWCEWAMGGDGDVD